MSIVATEALIGSLPPERIRGIQNGTVIADFESVNDLRVLMDGDSAESHVMSWVGELQAGQRVAVVFLEPHGAYVAWLLAPPAWRALPLGTGWTNRGTVATIVYQPAQIRRVGDMVQLRGEVYRSSGVGTTIATAPTGFVIPKAQGFAGSSAGAFASLFALDTGVIYYNGGGTPGSSLSLADVTYSVTP